MFLLNEEKLNEGFMAYAFGSMFNFNKNRLSQIDPNMVKEKTDAIDVKMKAKGYKPLNRPSKEQMGQMLIGTVGRYKDTNGMPAGIDYSNQALAIAMMNPLMFLSKFKYSFCEFNGRTYYYIQSCSFVKKQPTGEEGNIGAIYPMYINDKEHVMNGLIWITNKMLKK